MTRQEQKSRTVGRNLFWFFLVIIAACDLFERDHIPPSNLLTFGQREYYILPGTSVLIDLNSVVKQSFINATIKISKDPQHGQLFPLDMMSLKYQPSKQFTSGTDWFDFSVLQGGKIISTNTIRITIIETSEDFPCGIFAIDDYAVGGINSSIAIKILENDRICGVESNLLTSIFIQPKHGEVAVKGDSIVYIPESGFLGKDSLAYKLSTTDNQSDENPAVSYGIVNVTVLDIEADCFEWPDSYVIDLTDTLDDNVNSTYTCGTGYDFQVFKGLETCPEAYRSIGPFLKNPGGICFGSKDGRVLYLPHAASPENTTALVRLCVNDVCKDVVLRVILGRTNPEKTPGWSLIETNAGTEVFTRIRFVDELTGYIAGPKAMLKTTDGGKSWASLPFTLLSKNGVEGFLWDLDFINSHYGYATDGYSIGGTVRTTDGGHSWTNMTPLSGVAVYSLDFVNSQLGFVAVRDSSRPEGLAILKTTDGGSSWRKVLSFGFSYFPKVRFTKFGAIGYVLHMSTIYRTDDYGETWDVFFTNVHPPISYEYGESNYQIPDIALASAAEILIANPSHVHCDIYRAKNGQNWRKVQSVIPCGFGALSPGGSLGVFFTTGSFTDEVPFPIFISTDWAQTWKKHSIDPGISNSFEPMDAAVPSEDVVYILGINGKILRYVRD